MHHRNAPPCSLLFHFSNVEALSYPILFPLGEPCWQMDMQHFINQGSSSHALLQAEQHNFKFISQSQAQLYIEQYNKLMNPFRTRLRSRSTWCSVVILLPSSYQGPPRNLTKRYDGVMVTVAGTCKSNFFISIHCH